jgi:hypothetical protein
LNSPLSVALRESTVGWLRVKVSVPFAITPPVAVWICPVKVPAWKLRDQEQAGDEEAHGG